MPEVDDIIIGQGLAGSVLAWQLHWLGRRVLVIDREDTQTASRIAAGLITPVTGMRFVETWRFAEFWPAAVEFYRRFERDTGMSIFRVQPAVRIFASQAEVDNYAKRLAAGKLNGQTQPPRPPLNSEVFQQPFGAFEMPSAARLDTTLFLAATRSMLEQTNSYLRADIDSTTDVEPNPENIELPRFNLKAKRMFFCEGIAARNNAWFADVAFDSAAGEILTVRINGLIESRTIHRGLWLTAEKTAQVFRVGATYNREDQTGECTSAGKETILNGLQEFVSGTVEVLQHDAAVRPIVVGRNPVIGRHPTHAGMWLFNGLASKGALQAPAVVAHLVEAATGECSIDPEYDYQLRRKT